MTQSIMPGLREKAANAANDLEVCFPTGCSGDTESDFFGGFFFF